MRIERCGSALRILCPAKVNLFLEVLGKRPDGYHEISTVMQAVTLYDVLEIEEAAELSLTVEPPVVGAGEENLVVRAARLLQERAGRLLGAAIRLKKNIPVGGGLGGGSSDAAGALRGLCELWRMNAFLDEVPLIAAAVGSDVSFFLHGGTALGTGRGEKVEPLSWNVNVAYVLVCPDIAISTREMYESVNCLTRQVTKNKIRQSFVGQVEVQDLADGLYNAFEPVAFGRHPVLREIKGALLDAGALGALLSGSGSTMFGMCTTRAEAERIASEMKRFGRAVVVEPE